MSEDTQSIIGVEVPGDNRMLSKPHFTEPTATEEQVDE